MSKQRSKATIRKRTQPPARWGRYILAGVLLLTVLVAASTAGQLLVASGSPDMTAVSATASSVDNAVASSAGVGSAHTLYAHGHRLRPLVEETGGAQTLNIYGPGGQIIAQATRDDQGSEAVRHLLADHLGSTRAALDGGGNAVARHEYGPYGETATSGAAAAELRYRYTGHAYDEEQGVYETPARGYDPTTGRFLSVDPQRQDASPYVYVGNNPVLYKDPTGRGRVGTTVTPKVRALADQLVGVTSTYESNSKLMQRINDRKVKAWFDAFETLHDRAPELYHDFVDRMIHLNDFQEDNMEALGYRFSDLEGAVPQLPRTDVEQRVKIMSNMKEHSRGYLRHVAGDRHRRRVIRRDFEGNLEAFYKSKRAMDSLLVTPKNERPDPDARKGYGNCYMISSCIGGQIAGTDPEVNVELIQADPSVDHSFVLVGRDPKTDVSKPMTWNESALIVDGWSGLVTNARQHYAQGIDTRRFNTEYSPKLLYAFE